MVNFTNNYRETTRDVELNMTFKKLNFLVKSNVCYLKYIFTMYIKYK